MKKLLVLCVSILIIKNAVCLEETDVQKKSKYSCGLSGAGPIVQKVTRPLTISTGLFWSYVFYYYGEKLSYVDGDIPSICTWTPDGQLNHLEIKEGKTAVSVHPISRKTLEYIVGLDTSLYHIKVYGNHSQFYTANLIKQVAPKNSTLIKVKTDPTGALWITSRKNETVGNLLRVDANQITSIGQNFQIPNGFAWSHDGKKFYLVDELAKIIYGYNYDYRRRTISNQTIVFDANVHFPKGGLPSDVVLDTEGNLWISMSEIGQVIKFDPKKSKVVLRISIPAQFPVSLEFGGTYLKNLFVGTSRRDNASITDPEAGSIFAISGTGAQGFASKTVADYIR